MRQLPHFIQSPLLRTVPGAYHAFLGVDPAEGRRHGERLSQAFSIPPESIGTLKQVHSATVLESEPGDADVPVGRKREGDALWTAAPGTGVAVRTADCVPILLAHREIPFAAAVHAGWRGLAAGIVRETVRAFSDRFGERAVSGLVAAAGPCAGECCYEVGEETYEALRGIPGADASLRKGDAPGKWFADLRAIALSALVDAEVPPPRAEGVGPCTICSPRFHSYRREKALTGRQLSFIYILKTPFRFRKVIIHEQERRQ